MAGPEKERGWDEPSTQPWHWKHDLKIISDEKAPLINVSECRRKRGMLAWHKGVLEVKH